MNAEITLSGNEFVQRFSTTRRGARLARRLAAQQLATWGVPFGTGLSDDVALVVSELTANAVLHGNVSGRDFELRLLALPDSVRVEVSDSRGERVPELGAPEPEAGSGYGLHLVEALSRAWGVRPRIVGKTVWAEVVADAGAGFGAGAVAAEGSVAECSVAGG
ncbi:ATP-binding protein [Streptomyces sp. NPDC052095]|uniref:ATP-binding protein n=1 Tax=unclassified Streptomyces TaxID=2593676 RepID=UPI00344C4C45